MKHKPRYEVRVMGGDWRPVTNWQWCPDPAPEPLTARMGLAMRFEVPEMQVIAKGEPSAIELRLDGKVIFLVDLPATSRVKRGDTFRVTDLYITMEAG